MPNFQLSIDDYLASLPEKARGETCEAEDVPRLCAQGQAVYRYVRDLRPHTLREISAATGAPEASASARLREIRHYLSDNGLGTVIRERAPGGNGLHTYSLRLNRTFGAA